MLTPTVGQKTPARGHGSIHDANAGLTAKRMAPPLHQQGKEKRNGRMHARRSRRRLLGNEFAAVTDKDASAILGAPLGAAWRVGIRYDDGSVCYGLGLAERRFGSSLRNRNRSEYLISSKDKPRSRIQGNAVFQKAGVRGCIGLGGGPDRSPTLFNPRLAANHAMVALLEVSCHG